MRKTTMKKLMLQALETFIRTQMPDAPMRSEFLGRPRLGTLMDGLLRAESRLKRNTGLYLNG